MRAARQGPQPHEPLVRVRRLGEPVEQQRQQLLHEPRGTCEAPGELVQGLAGALCVGEAEGGEALLGGVRGEAMVTGRLPARPRGVPGREGLEERPEVEALVDRPPRALMTREDGVEPLRRSLERSAGKPENPRQAVPRLAIGRHRVNLRLLDELEAVLDGAQEAVGDGQRRRVRGRDVAGVGELGEGGQRGAKPQGRVAAAVHQLQQLHGELDVPDAPAAALELPVVEAPASDQRLGAGLHRAQLGELVGTEAPGPQVLRRRLFELPAGSRLSRRVPGLQEGLEFPGPGPPLPVGDIGGQRPDERPRPPLRAQVGVDAVGARGDGDDGAGERG